MYGEAILSRVIDENSVDLLKRHGIERDHFPTQAEREVYDYIHEYAKQNGGKAPGYAVVVADHPEFNYVADDGTSFSYMCSRLKDAAAKRGFAELVNDKLSEAFENNSFEKFSEWLTENVNDIKIRNTNILSIGRTLDELKTEFRDEYNKRKAGKSFKLWRTPFKALNDEIGGLYSGDIYGVMAESGRGKSYLIIAFIDELLRQGAKVLVKSYELKAYLWLSRLMSVLTAREEIIEGDGGVKVGLPNREILAGKLNEGLEMFFLSMVDSLNSYYPGELILQAKGDDYLTRSLKDLDRELTQRPDIDAVVVDPFYGLDDVYGKNANRTAGGAAEQAARKFEQIVGRHDVVGIYAVQASTDKKAQDEDGNRELKLPTRDQVKTSKALLEIATNLFAFDSNDGTAILGVEKGRNGAEDFRLELTALLDYGVLRELPTGEAVAAQFGF
ncbi:AAA family ATPase [Fictibacillus sp. Mic-4]|uniref:AAA family ATPase n=1 Tax=Fictibacillus sp. Mic-4 TaxID=3132826 RepID=UPI003CE6F857